jgi:hypothetical protein
LDGRMKSLGEQAKINTVPMTLLTRQNFYRLFEIKPVPRGVVDADGSVQSASNSSEQTAPLLKKVYVSPLDFRAPENYIFLPAWVMRSLGLRSFDLVDVSFVRIKLAALVVLQPLNLEWDALVLSGRNPRAILEHEVNKYSSLTSGADISIEHEGVRYLFHVKETRAEGGVAVRGVRVQDSDIKVIIDDRMYS